MKDKLDLHWFLNLEDIKKGEIFSTSVSFDEADSAISYWGQEYLLKFPLTFDVQAHWANEELRVDLETAFRVEVPCARCLKPVLLDISEGYEYIYTLRKPSSEPDHELTEEEMSMVHIKFWPTHLDLSPQLWESIILSLPSVALCDPDCRGLCPHCGKDLNVDSCDCAFREVDPRLEALKKAKISLSGLERRKERDGHPQKKGFSRKNG
ncbi:YceD family protein [Acetomicrobium hydrogeniformans]|uniref:Putative ACR protein n=1 Tax=Acetomicrobium hydrogeniformans ATCC BAA-1850 TaxID=592015 RepID=A0A0T5XC83_9BACT|nr:DUF177 domain-containing protein [Acetomicrobium hydrogeniformans]KRT35943.1 putative ACR protein [Acetomicrobium hydrogeniformans ATCC BAA-1850]